jgi:hypothetical protein
MVMNSQTGVYLRGMEHLSPDERHRLRRAEQICDQIADEAAVKLDAIEEATACVEYVHGQLDEVNLWERASAELKQRRS